MRSHCHSEDRGGYLLRIAFATKLQSKDVMILRNAGGPAGGSIDAIAWSPDDPNLFVSAGADKMLRFWDARSGKMEHAIQLKTDNVLYIAWHPDGQVLAVGTRDDYLLFVDARRSSIDSRKGGVLYSKQQEWEMNEISWSPSGLLFISAGPRTQVETFEGVVFITQPINGFTAQQSVAQLKAHTGQIQSLKFDPQFRHFVTSSVDSTIAVWDVQELAVARMFDRLEFAAKSLSFSHDGQYLATASDDKIVDIVSAPIAH